MDSGLRADMQGCTVLTLMDPVTEEVIGPDSVSYASHEETLKLRLKRPTDVPKFVTSKLRVSPHFVLFCGSIV